MARLGCSCSAAMSTVDCPSPHIYQFTRKPRLIGHYTTTPIVLIKIFAPIGIQKRMKNIYSRARNTLIGIAQLVKVGSHGCIKLLTDHPFFEKGLKHIVHRLHPKTIIVNGAAPDKIFKPYRKMGIYIVQFDIVFMSSHRKAVSE